MIDVLTFYCLVPVILVAAVPEVSKVLTMIVSVVNTIVTPLVASTSSASYAVCPGAGGPPRGRLQQTSLDTAGPTQGRLAPAGANLTAQGLWPSSGLTPTDQLGHGWSRPGPVALFGADSDCPGPVALLGADSNGPAWTRLVLPRMLSTY